MEVKIKKLHEDAQIPQYAKNGDAGMDLTAVSRSYDEFGNVVYGTGVAIEIPKGFVGLLFPRSSISKTDLSLSCAVGVIDSGYRGEITLKFKPTLAFTSTNVDNIPTIADNYETVLTPSGGYVLDKTEQYGLITDDATHYELGDRVGQLIIMPYPCIEFTEVTKLSETDRGDGGYGSTGN